jgi:endogenous inhibitor of DNA gyrase (YacG/DUF329 family)
MMARGETAKCPMCRRPSSRETAGKVFPFCSARCWAIDLGKWLGEEYRVPEQITDEPSGPLRPDDPES